MNLTESNLISLDTELKQGQRCIRIGNSIIPVGVGGIFAPGSDSSAPAGADVTLGVVDSQGRFQALRFNGTQASNSGSALEVQNYKTWNSTLPAPQPSGGSMDFYKCSYVNSDSWGGYKAVQDPVTGVYSFESDSTGGLAWSSNKPSAGLIYTTDAAIHVNLNTSEPLPQSGLIVSAMPDVNWPYGPVSSWGDFAQTDPAYQPRTEAFGGKVGIKAREGDSMVASGTSITGDFTYLHKLYLNPTMAFDHTIQFISDNYTGGAITGFYEENNQFLLSWQGQSAIFAPNIDCGQLSGVHTIAVTFAATDGMTKFYLDGTLVDSGTYANVYFAHSTTFYYPQAQTADILVLGLAAYNRVLTASEIAAINW